MLERAGVDSSRVGRLMAITSLACLGVMLALLFLVPVTPRLRAPAVLVPSGQQIDVVTPIRGRLDTLYVAEGEAVTRGQKLFLISDLDSGEPAEQASRLEDHDAQIASIQAQLKVLPGQRLALGTRAADIQARQRAVADQLKRSIASERQRLVILDEKIRAYRTASEQGLISRTEFLNASNESLLSQAGLADRERLLLESQASAERELRDVLYNQADLASREAELQGELARVRGERSRYAESLVREVVAPRNGIVAGIGYSAGTHLAEGTPVLWIGGGAAPRQVLALVPEENIDAVYVGQDAVLEIESSLSVHPIRLRARVIEVGHSIAEKQLRAWQPTTGEGRGFQVRLELADAGAARGVDDLRAMNGRSATVMLAYASQPIAAFLFK